MNKNLDGLINGSKKAFDFVGRKTGDAIGYSKTQVEKTQMKIKFREKLTELGRLCYEMHKTDIDYTGSMKNLIIELDDLDRRMKFADEALGTPVVCGLCGTKNDSSNTYCTKCGERLR